MVTQRSGRKTFSIVPSTDRRKRRLKRVLIALLVAGFAYQAPRMQLKAAECIVGGKPRFVWFSPESHYPPVKGANFLDLFKPGAAWDESAGHIDTVKLSTQFFTYAPTEVIKSVVTTLKNKNIKLALEGESGCGRFPGTPTLAETVSQKIINAGGKLDLIALDEPMWHVHFDQSTAGCRLSIEGAAEQTATVINVYKRHFPGAIVGEVEPFPTLTEQLFWSGTLTQFIKTLQEQTGTPIIFLHADINWRDARVNIGGIENLDPIAVSTLLQTVAAAAARLKLNFGIIYNGKATARSDAEWLRDAREHAAIIEKSDVHPHDVIFQSWHAHPSKTLPDRDPDSFLNTVNWFCSRQSSDQVQ